MKDEIHYMRLYDFYQMDKVNDCWHLQNLFSINKFVIRTVYLIYPNAIIKRWLDDFVHHVMYNNTFCYWK